MFCAPVLLFGGIECIGSRFHVLRAQTRFRPYQGRRVPFSCLALPDWFLAVSWASSPVFLFCTPGLVFGSSESVLSRFHVFRSRTCFWPYRGRRVHFSCFALPDSFSVVSRASGAVFMYCAPGLVFGGTEGVESCFHVLRCRNRFRPNQGSRVSFSCFALPDSFLEVLSASGPVFMFCARTRYRRYRGRRVSFSCFARPDSFSTVPRASGPVFMFGAPGLVFGGNVGVGFRFHVLRSRISFRRYRGRRVPFSCFALPDLFSALPGASGVVFMFCGAGLFFDGTGVVGSLFHLLRS
jgi:hypothetical protein